MALEPSLCLSGSPSPHHRNRENVRGPWRNVAFIGSTPHRSPRRHPQGLANECGSMLRRRTMLGRERESTVGTALSLSFYEES
jgi:hypothetical protein